MSRDREQRGALHDFQEVVVEPDTDELNVFLDEDLSKKNEIEVKSRKLTYFLIGLAVCTVVATLLVIASLTTGLAILETRVTPPPPYVDFKDMKNSVEFQITLTPREDWYHRDRMIDYWITSMNELSTLMVFYRNDTTMDIYKQDHYRTEGLGHCRSTGGLKVRYRSYVFGKKYTIDIKKDEELNEKCNQPYWPAEKYYHNDTFDWKCEEDVHPCFMKYTMQSRVYLQDPDRKFKTCGDLVEVFPDAFPLVDEKNIDNSIKKDPDGYWYKLQWNGMVGKYTTYQVTFTIKYNTMDAATTGHGSVSDGEWSLRYWVPEGEEWEADIVAEFQDFYYTLILEYDTYDDHLTCSDKFFNDESLSYIGVEMDDQL